MQLYHQDYSFSDITLRYLFDRESGAVSLVLFPKEKAHDAYGARRQLLQSPELEIMQLTVPAWQVGSLVHLALRHHSQSNTAGTTLKNGPSTAALKFVAQERDGEDILTFLEAEEGYSVLHRVSPRGNALAVTTEFHNHTGRDVTLDMLTSFSLDNLSPYQTADGRHLNLHRFRGGWSIEGKHTVTSVEELNLLCPWFYGMPESERFGVLGSHPVKRFFPVCAVEDADHSVFWGASLSAASSWQMELSRDSDCFSLSGGIADCEFGGWYRTVPDGCSFTAPTAYVSVGTSLDEVCDHLTSVYHEAADRQPESEQNLPVVFNEWCTTWGSPSHDRMVALADCLRGSPVKYLVIDAGWTDVVPGTSGQGGNGDWIYDPKKFPKGLLATSRAARERGFALGIWFEFEVTTDGARVYGHDYDHLHLKRNGEVVVTGGGRSFWDFRKPEVVSYLKEKVVDFLRDNQIGYLKVDYNGSIGVGCDGSESVGNGLYEQMQAVLDFFSLMREELPELVIENCASGGHRLVAPFLERTAMSSFSDAHECKEIPVIAARLHRLALPRQLQIWAVLNPDQDQRELCYRLASGFLGRLCLSGSVDRLDESQMATVRKAMALYEKAASVIKYGKTTVSGDEQENIRHLHGHQAVVRVSQDEKEALVVVHGFPQAPETVTVALPEGQWEVEASLNEALTYACTDGCLSVNGLTDCSGTVVLLRQVRP